MTASDARPPSDTGATGWHIHGASGQPCRCAITAVTISGGERTAPRPVLVVDPAEAREVIARAIWESDMASDLMPGGSTWESESDRAMYLANADAVLAALGGQEGGQS